MRRTKVIVGLLLVLMVGCGGSTPPTVAPTDENTPLRPLAEIWRGDYDGATVNVLAPVLRRSNGQVLVPALSVVGAEPTPLLDTPASAIVLGGDPLIGLTDAGATAYGVVNVRGTVQVGADGVRQIQPTSSKVLVPTSITLAALQRDSSVYQGQVVAISGTLIIKADAALLVEAVGSGGVPSATAVQIKIVQPFNDAALVAALPNTSGTIRYGEATLTGIWQGNALVVFWGE